MIDMLTRAKCKVNQSTEDGHHAEIYPVVCVIPFHDPR